MTEKKSSHLGLGLAIGTIIGVATGLFVQSKKGKELMKDVEKKAAALQTKLMKELKNAEDLSKDKYEDMVDKVTDYYVKTKDVTKKEVPEVKKYLMKKWSAIERQLKSK
ncbi:YtxH domain-containing protein [Candidatus Uhrbacteria bacterium]|nr:YtxH domain-containing protein [Candidatus Uhrbacteria bacterium]